MTNYPHETPRWRRYIDFWRANVQRDVDDELRFHFESRIEELTAQGISRNLAYAKAMEEFGDVSQTRARLTEIDRRTGQRRAQAERLRDIADEFRYAFRSLSRSPGMAVAILATLALGVGANAAMFTLLDAIFIRPPAAVVAADGVRRLWFEQRYVDGIQFSQITHYAQYRAVGEALGDRAAVTLYRAPAEQRIGSGETTVRAQVSIAPASYFSLLGIRAKRGRIYSGDEDLYSSVPDVAVISDPYWKRELGGDPGVLGRLIDIAGTRYKIIGVAATNFVGSDLNAADIWLPVGVLGAGPKQSTPWWDDRNVNGFNILIRPAPHALEGELEQRTSVALAHLEPNRKGDMKIRLGSILVAGGPGKKRQETQIAVRLAGVAAIVLLIACANVTNLLLSRAVRRRREIAVRLAMGISRGRLVRLLLTESATLAVFAAAVSILVAYAGGSLLRKLLLPDVHWSESPVDWPVILLALGVALAAGVLSGLVPALKATTPDLTSALKSGGSGGGTAIHRSRLRTALVMVQAALSVVLLVGALLFVRSLSNVKNLDLGWDSRSVISASAYFDDPVRRSDPERQTRMRQLETDIAALPGVERTALANVDPMGGFGIVAFYTEVDSLGSQPKFFPTVTAVTSGYFAATGLRVLRGSDFPRQSSGDAPQVIVNETMAKVLWPGQNPLGKCIHVETKSAACSPVRAVVGDSRMEKLIEDPQPKFYISLDNPPLGEAKTFTPNYVVARVTPERSAAAVNDMRAALRSAFPGGVPRVRRLSETLEPQYRPWRLGATLFTTFGVLALIVAAVGMYSTVSYTVNQRAHEFGVRIALGASVSNVLRLVLGDALRVVALGILAGVGLSLAAGKLIASLLYGVNPRDPAVMVGVGATLLVIGAIAALVPAWRASRVDPVTSLRAD